MSREEDLKRDREFYDNAYQEGVSPIDNPYFGMTEAEWDKELAEARRKDDLEDFYKKSAKRKEELAETLKNMTPEERKQHDEIKEREDYYRGMDPDKRSAAYERDNELLEARKTEEQRQAEESKEQGAKMLAFKRAKARYQNLSPVIKLFAKKPDKLNIENMKSSEINALYGGKSK